MKLTELWKNKQGPTLSFELYPARDEKAQGKLDKAIDKLVGLKPDFCAVTFGAGGSTREGSYQLVRHLIQERRVDVVSYFACFGLGPDDIFSALDAYRALGVETILAVRGDPPHGQDSFKPHPQAPAHATDLIDLLAPRYDFCLGAAGYPEGHLEATDRDADLEFVKQKVERGAQFIITNYTYDNAHYFDFVERVRALGVEVPVLPGVMPIYSVKMMRNLAKLCGASIPDSLQSGLDALPEGDKGALFDFSVELAVRLCTELIEGGAPGVHLYTMDRAKACGAIAERLRAAGTLPM